MTLVLTPLIPPPPRTGASRRLRRLALMGVGLFIMLVGLIIAPLPGPGGIPVITLGLVIVLRNSFWAKRQFIKAQRAKPNWVYPFRRLMRKNPEVAPVFWQQALRMEKMVVRSRRRRALPRLRRRLRARVRAYRAARRSASKAA
ncbi:MULTISPECIES: PGPGW domain-containing protein [Brevundimonas]|uniref:PGPGW domain-containing protein n=1 Tax=Brevundimonas pishanensis TaxID=2896315 RepID=UPI001FA8017F